MNHFVVIVVVVVVVVVVLVGTAELEEEMNKLRNELIESRAVRIRLQADRSIKERDEQRSTYEALKVERDGSVASLHQARSELEQVQLAAERLSLDKVDITASCNKMISLLNAANQSWGRSSEDWALLTRDLNELELNPQNIVTVRPHGYQGFTRC
jgi:Sec-independent protein translocase protein TatA